MWESWWDIVPTHIYWSQFYGYVLDWGCSRHNMMLWIFLQCVVYVAVFFCHRLLTINYCIFLIEHCIEFLLIVYSDSEVTYVSPNMLICSDYIVTFILRYSYKNNISGRRIEILTKFYPSIEVNILKHMKLRTIYLVD